MIGALHTLYRKLRRNQQGVVTVELALVAPVLILMLLGTADMVTYLLAHQKMSRAAYSMSNLLTQLDEGLNEAEMNDIMAALDEISRPYEISADGKAVMTAIIGDGASASAPDEYRVAWKRCFGTGTGTSDYGDEDAIIAIGGIPADMIVLTNQMLIVTEVFYEFKPLLGFLDLDTSMKYTSYFRPRLGTIDEIVPVSGSAPQVCS
ncbi:pilus biosynthesis protein TadE [Kordiimonas sediminis]|uniref:Pilus biosynthesis protein TadE n=1 Tax=Kordiimonas sediminis TaxID=1735581 RepID=A0A919ASZ6_9PROT|nr:tight adherence pilus pseudopilin TadF [Kordiimonas sediminis]GHF24084.1 pilus biosynthesis protein TadE [Kordiimonas sediminis]